MGFYPSDTPLGIKFLFDDKTDPIEFSGDDWKERLREFLKTFDVEKKYKISVLLDTSSTYGRQTFTMWWPDDDFDIFSV